VHRSFANPWDTNRHRPLAANGDAARAKVNDEGGVFVDTKDGGAIWECAL
jgi:hypothetical protein